MIKTIYFFFFIDTKHIPTVTNIIPAKKVKFVMSHKYGGVSPITKSSLVVRSLTATKIRIFSKPAKAMKSSPTKQSINPNKYIIFLPLEFLAHQQARLRVLLGMGQISYRSYQDNGNLSDRNKHSVCNLLNGNGVINLFSSFNTNNDTYQ
ncbi:hypothetical protein [Paenibacillus tianmuensis]|uniref:hypothetical protein n=1 Tax=Paenibacillus tianmuensis TaxID=624147 RepID=UPI001C25A553|nr:hypothetical protein [Paenibacillus tianmuensis]